MKKLLIPFMLLAICACSADSDEQDKKASQGEAASASENVAANTPKNKADDTEASEDASTTAINPETEAEASRIIQAANQAAALVEADAKSQTNAPSEIQAEPTEE